MLGGNKYWLCVPMQHSPLRSKVFSLSIRRNVATERCALFVSWNEFLTPGRLLPYGAPGDMSLASPIINSIQSSDWPVAFYTEIEVTGSPKSPDHSRHENRHCVYFLSLL